MILLQGDGRRHFSPAGEYPTAFTPEGFIATDLTGDRYADLAVPGNLPHPGFPPDLNTRVSILVNRSGRRG